MQYEVTVKFLLRSRSSAETLTRQLESVLDFGTAREAIADGLGLNDDPNVREVRVRRYRRKPGGNTY